MQHLELPYIRLMPDTDLANLPLNTRFAFKVRHSTDMFLALFTASDGRCVEFGLGHGREIETSKLAWMFNRFQFISFGGAGYDLPLLQVAMGTGESDKVQQLAYEIITNHVPSWKLEEEFKLSEITQKEFGIVWKNVSHIDLRGVCPHASTLRAYASRLHAPDISGTPYRLCLEHINHVRSGTALDCANMHLIADNLQPQIDLRRTLGREYNTDLRSMSDAQIAEKVICLEIYRATKKWPAKSGAAPKHVAFRKPEFIQFEDPKLRQMTRDLALAEFPLSKRGSPEWPDGMDRDCEIGGKSYRIGAGGLHSCEKSESHTAGDGESISEHDISSCYPRILLNQGLYPKHLGVAFLKVFNALVDERLIAKRKGDQSASDSLKIVINGAIGKFANRHSRLYAPEKFLQVTVTGQLALLMLIERFALKEIEVIKANTDGVVIRIGAHQVRDREDALREWEADCGFETDQTDYAAIYSRDVNNYIALKSDGSVKLKGIYGKPTDPVDCLAKNPNAEICIDAVVRFLTQGISSYDTILKCSDIRKFLEMRSVKDGAYQNGIYLGKTVRWYRSIDAAARESLQAPIVTSNSSLVPTSSGGCPVQRLPDEVPADLHRGFYIDRVKEMLDEIGFEKPVWAFK